MPSVERSASTPIAAFAGQRLPMPPRPVTVSGRHSVRSRIGAGMDRYARFEGGGRSSPHAVAAK
jgi:hypothetical protein